MGYHRVSITRMKASVALAFALFAIVGSVVTADFSDDFEDDFVADQAEFVQNEADATPMVTTAVKKPLSGKQRGQIWKTIAPAKDGGYSKKDEEKMKAAKQQKKAKKQAKKAVVKLSPAARAKIYHRLHPGKSATLAQVTRCNFHCHRRKHKKSRAHCYVHQSACHCRNWHNKRAGHCHKGARARAHHCHRATNHHARKYHHACRGKKGRARGKCHHACNHKARMGHRGCYSRKHAGHRACNHQ